VIVERKRQGKDVNKKEEGRTSKLPRPSSRLPFSTEIALPCSETKCTIMFEEKRNKGINPKGGAFDLFDKKNNTSISSQFSFFPSCTLISFWLLFY
jgi:hypothetical protein